MIEKHVESVLEVDFEGWVHCQEPEIVGKTSQKKQHHEQRQSYNLMDNVQASEYSLLAMGEERLGGMCKTVLERKIMG